MVHVAHEQVRSASPLFPDDSSRRLHGGNGLFFDAFGELPLADALQRLTLLVGIPRIPALSESEVHHGQPVSASDLLPGHALELACVILSLLSRCLLITRMRHSAYHENAQGAEGHQTTRTELPSSREHSCSRFSA